MMKIMYCEWAFCPCQIECPHPSYMLSWGQPKASHPSTAPAAWCPGRSLNSHTVYVHWSRGVLGAAETVTLSTALVTLCHTVYCPGHFVSHCLLVLFVLSRRTLKCHTLHRCHLPFLTNLFARACSCYQFLARACSCKPLCCTQLPFSVNGSHTDLPLQTNQPSASR